MSHRDRSTFVRRIRSVRLPLAAVVVVAVVTQLGTADDVPRLSGPHEHANLSVFFIHGEDELKGREVLTLEEAFARGKVIVRETGTVGLLTIENLSDHELFLQAGDIVRGGKQDRVVRQDRVLSARSGQVAVPAYCVERGRWSARGDEPVGNFTSAKNAAVGNAMKIAVRTEGNQSRVWTEVEVRQSRMAGDGRPTVQAAASPTSLELALEHPLVKAATQAYLDALLEAPSRRDDVVGVVIFLNGRPHAAQSFAGPGLFSKLWPKLLRTIAVEAVGEMGAEAGPFPRPTREMAAAFLAEAAAGAGREDQVSEHVKTITRDGERTKQYETFAHGISFSTGSFVAMPEGTQN